MTQLTRRTLVKSLSAGIVATPILTASLTTRAQTTAKMKANIPNAFASNNDLKPLPFDSSQLDGLSKKLVDSHWQNNYGGSVRALNTIKQQLQQALANDDTPAFLYNDLKREHLMRTGSVVLHEYYFDNLSPPQARDKQLDKELTAAFGSVQTWEKEFRRIGAGLGGGSGWVMLAWNTHTQTLENYWLADHMHTPAASLPILVMDMYEHSYHMDYGAATAKYIDAFFKNINWQAVTTRLDSALTGG